MVRRLTETLYRMYSMAWMWFCFSCTCDSHVISKRMDFFFGGGGGGGVFCFFFFFFVWGKKKIFSLGVNNSTKQTFFKLNKK